jgi:hypothetical protein
MNGIKQETIDLGQYRTADAIVFSGREKGEAIRERVGLNRLDTENVIVTIRVPDQIVSLNSSFFLGLFAESIRRLGIEGFDRKYQFKCSDVVREDIERGKRQAQNTSNPLGTPLR